MSTSDSLVVATPERAWTLPRVSVPRWCADAWMSIAVTVLFIGISCWWLTVDRSIPIFDAGLHLALAVDIHELLSGGHIGDALVGSVPYPPFTYLVGSLGLAIGGTNVAPPIVAQNLVFVPLLALGCYNLGRLAFGARAGLLAVVFALGSPLITAQFHVFMVDAPETAMVAVSVWLIVATEGFSRIWISAATGVVVGLGLVTKEPFAFFVAGVVCVTAVRGGWSAWRGLAMFAVPALAIALPWYISELAQVRALGTAATNASGNSQFTNGIDPARLSFENFMWYFWNISNAQLFAPLFLFSIVGWGWTVLGLVRRRSISPLAWELLVGSFVAWVWITETFVHDTRYSMPLLVYLAVLGSGWIVRLRSVGRRVATAALVLIAVVNTLTVSFGLGGVLSFSLPISRAGLLQRPGTVTVYSNAGFLVAGPKRDGDVLALMRALKRNGIRQVEWGNYGSKEQSPEATPDFSEAGLVAFAQIAKLKYPLEEISFRRLGAHDALLGHWRIEPGEPPPCVRLSDGTGIWIRLGNPTVPGIKNYCPYHHPVFY